MTFFTSLKSRSSSAFRHLRTRTTRLVNRFPLLSFVLILGTLVALIAIGNQFRKPKTDTTQSAPVVKEVEIYTLDSSPQIQVQAQVEKSGVIKLVALTGGVVQKIHFTEGEHVNRGSRVISLSSNYQGGNTSSVARQISYKNYQFQVDTYDVQQEMIARNQAIAIRGETQQAELRDIARRSIGETQSLITLNEEILSSLDDQIEVLEVSDPLGQLVGVKSQKAQVLAALNGLRSGLRNTEYLNSENQEPASIGRLTRDNTLRQLEIQEKSLTLSRDLAALNLKLSQITESLMFPASPCPGTVERVLVKIGQNVTPGTLLATIRGDLNTASAVALVSSDVAQSTSRLAESTALISGHQVALQTRYISQEPTEGTLHAITFTVPDEVASTLSDGSFLQVSLPVGIGIYSTGSTYIPLDAVYQSQNTATVYVAESQADQLRAKSRVVTLGHVYGRFVEVLNGIQAGDKVIINRNVIEDDLVSLK